MKLIHIDPATREAQIRKLQEMLAPLGFVNQHQYTFYHLEYKITIDFSAIAIDKALEWAATNIYNAGMNYGIESTQRVLRNALGIKE